jgi:hypothetical protein
MGTLADPIYRVNRLKFIKDPYYIKGQQARKVINPVIEMNEAHREFRKA